MSLHTISTRSWAIWNYFLLSYFKSCLLAQQQPGNLSQTCLLEEKKRHTWGVQQKIQLSNRAFWVLQINSHRHFRWFQSTLDKVQMYVLVYSIVAFVLVKQIAELLHVQLMQRVQFLGRRLPVLLHRDRPSHWKEGAHCPCISALKQWLYFWNVNPTLPE